MPFPDIHLPATLTSTRALYHEDATQRSAYATVLWAEDAFVVVDQTPFYALAGGQESDFGFIAGQPVIDVQHHGGHRLDPLPALPDVPVETVLVHKLSEPARFGVGMTVKMEIDWPRRYAIMRAHSACHFVFEAVTQICGASKPLELGGCRIHPNGSRMDFRADINSTSISQIEAWTNAAIARGKLITTEPVPDALGLFMWQYGDEFALPCGGTHVGSASELGPVKLKRDKPGRGLTRLITTWRSDFA